MPHEFLLVFLVKIGISLFLKLSEFFQSERNKERTATFWIIVALGCFFSEGMHSFLRATSWVVAVEHQV